MKRSGMTKLLWTISRAAGASGRPVSETFTPALRSWMKTMVTLFDDKDDYRSAAALLFAGTEEETAGPPFDIRFTLAAYRLYTAGIRLLVTREEVLALSDRLVKYDVSAVEQWLRERSIPAIPPGSVQSRSVSSYTLKIRSAVSAHPGKDPPSLTMVKGQCRFLYTDRALGPEDLAADDPHVKPYWLRADLKGFDDLSLRMNMKFMTSLVPRDRLLENPDRWPVIRAMKDLDRTLLGSLDPARRLLFSLALFSALDNGPCLVIEKPPLGESAEMSFWHHMSSLAGKGPACLVVSGDPAGLGHCRNVSVIRDGRFLGSLPDGAAPEEADFTWVACRLLSPKEAAAIPFYLFKTTPLTGDLWISTASGRQNSDYFVGFMRERYGVALIPAKTVRPTLEERIIRCLHDESAPPPEVFRC